MKARNIAGTAALALVLLLAACSMREMAARMTPKGDLALVHSLFTQARKGDIAAETSLFAQGATPDTAELRLLHHLLATGGTPEITGVDVSIRSGQTTHTELTYRVRQGKQSYMIVLDIRGPDGQRRLQSVDIGQSVDLFTQFPGLGRIVRIISLVALALLAIVVALVIWLLRRRRTQRQG